MFNNTANLREILEILQTKGAVSGGNQGGSIGGSTEATTKYILYGTYLLLEKPSYTSPAKTCTMMLPANTVYAFTLNLTQGDDFGKFKYEPANVISFANFFFILYQNSATCWKDKTWHCSDAMSGLTKVDFPDDRYRIIDFKAPVEVTQEFYDLFMSMVANPDTTPYEIGYNVATEENPVAEISYDSNYKTLTITTS